MQSYFHELADSATALLRGGEVLLARYAGEASDFVRFNRSQVRQAGSVRQRQLSLDLIEGRRHAETALTLAGDPGVDRARVRSALEELREMRRYLPEDPHLLYAEDAPSAAYTAEDRLPEPDAVLEQVRRAGRGRDLVGIYAGGATERGFASSLGQRNWDGRHSFNLDWSLYCGGDKAAKAAYAGFEWEPAAFAARAERAAEQLAVLERPPRTVSPGRYRVFLAPAALEELVGTLARGGFSLRAHRTKTTPLLRMIERGARLHPEVSFAENTAEGVAPAFQEHGFPRPPRVTLIRRGLYEDTLVSPRSAAEYGVATNGSSAGESPLSIDLAPGSLEDDAVLAELGTGIYVSNLWYLNYSDRNACRTTGMTRFATFWVERGAIRAPLSVMRFDETLFHILGSNLLGLTRERDFILDARTYRARSARSARLPGALVDDFAFTL